MSQRFWDLHNLVTSVYRGLCCRVKNAAEAGNRELAVEVKNSWCFFSIHAYVRGYFVTYVVLFVYDLRKGGLVYDIKAP